MLYAVILAGGLSSRMGQDKSALLLEGQTLLERARRLLLSAGAGQVLVSGRPDLPNGIPDLLPHSGPPGGLYATLHYLNTQQKLDGSSRLLIIPVDMPLLSLATLRVMLEVSATVPACHFAGEVFPCVLPATPALYQHLQQLFAEDRPLGGRKSMKGILAFLQAKALSADKVPLHEFLNANTPEDWQHIAALRAKDA